MRLTSLVFALICGCSPTGEQTTHPERDLDSNTDIEHVDSGPSTPGDPESQDTDTSSGDDTAEEPVDCSLISAANAAWEVCEEGPIECAGVFTDGAGCEAYCASAGLVCLARYGGEPGCQKEPENPIDCDTSNGHQSDWCTCGPGESGGDEPAGGDSDCESDLDTPPLSVQIAYTDATYTERNNWVLNCRDYAYTAQSSEHQECDSIYQPDGSRSGTATFLFEDLPRGLYDAYMGGRHTENRNPSGALFIVDGHSVAIDQTTGSDYEWDYHGQYCLEGRVEVVLDSSVNNGSDSVFGVLLEPAD
jgi:hypothetical protein